MLALIDCCCGVDVHRDMIEVCILKGRSNDPEALRAQFKTTKLDLKNFVQWLSDNGCYTIAMESTGVYWRPVYETIEEYMAYYERIMVVNAHNMRNLPGRKNDIKDAEWIATLLRHGLLESSFIPERIIRNLREYSRLHKSFVQERSRYLNRLEKFLQTHGFKLSTVMSNILSKSGRNLLNTLVATGNIFPQDVIRAVDKRIKRPLEQIEEAVCGSLIKSECRLLEHILKKLDTCQEDIDMIIADMEELILPYKKEVEQMDSVPGIDTLAAISILAEIGAAPHECFKSKAHLCSWAGLKPRNDESAGKIKSKKTLHGNPYIKSILCQCSWAAVRVRKSSFAAWFWPRQGKLGRKKAIIAVARKILALIYTLLKNGEFYDSKVAFMA